MFDKRATPHIASILVLISSFAWIVPECAAQQKKKPFTVADEIDLTLFGTPSGGPPEIHFSPDGNYFAVWAECGYLDSDEVEDSLRFYLSQDVRSFLERSDESQIPAPVWVVTRTSKEGTIINGWRWSADSSGVAFLERTDAGDQRLVFADLRKRRIEPLTSPTEIVTQFDIRDRQHYVYTVVDSTERTKQRAELQRPGVLGTGRNPLELFFPERPNIARSFWSNRQYLQADVGGKHFTVMHAGAPLGQIGDYALSPDGQSLVTTLPVPEVPLSWETLYPPLYTSDPNRLHAGGSAHEYVRIDLQTGAAQHLTNAPVSYDVGTWEAVLNGPTWSSDGLEILLPGTFLKPKENAASRPCVAVIDLSSNAATCVQMLKGFTETGAEEGYRVIANVRFALADTSRIFLTFMSHLDWSIEGTTEYRRTSDGAWKITGSTKGQPKLERNGLEVKLKEGINDPPLLVAKNGQTSRIIWDPNPQLKNIELGEASVYTWKDKKGREQEGGLYKPVNYQPGQRYPLVIQTHGFPASEFKPSGFFTTAYAARALAAAGIVVLQLGERGCPYATPDQSPCAVSYYEAAASQLVSDGLVDPGRIGIIGFSASCWTVMEGLAFGSLHLKAASVTDGIMGSYSQYLFFENAGEEYDSRMGARPFGEGLLQWLKRSPAFNLDRVTTPLQVVAAGRHSLLEMWEPYAGLRDLHKPVELTLLNTDEHVLTNPAVRMASQGGSVDWFRFWLQDYEDPDPAKAEQYARWRKLRTMQADNEKKSPSSPPS